MTLIVKINEEVTALIDYSRKKKKIIRTVTQVTSNCSLIKYLLKLLRENSICKNDDGYATIRRINGKKTSLQRIIMEFYSSFNEELKEVVFQKYEGKEQIDVDHINNEKLDNRTENFQLLSHKMNSDKRTKDGYQVTTKNEYILKIDEEIRNLEQYTKDKYDLARLSNRFEKVLKTGIIEDIRDCCYFDLSSSTIFNAIADTSNVRDTIIRFIDYIENKMTEKNTILIQEIYDNKINHVVNKILNTNLALLNRYRQRYKYFDEVIKKYNILDEHYNYRINKDLNLYDYNYQLSRLNSKELLYDLYEVIIKNKDFTFENDNILKRIDLSMQVDKTGKYNSFRIMYMLGLLNRQNSERKTSFFSIPIYTEDLMKKANVIAKKILDLNLKKIRFFIVMEELGEETVKRVYKERFNKLKKDYEIYSIKAKEDIIKFLKEDVNIYENGFIKVEDIFEHIKLLNMDRASNGFKFNPVYSDFISFIKDLLQYNSYTKAILEELGFAYRSVNKEIIENIKEYQVKQGFTKINCDLKSRKRVIILKELEK